MIPRRAVLVGAAALSVNCAANAEERLITGVNLAGLEFNSGRLPGRLHHDYEAPRESSLDYYRSKGASAIRLPFRWERLQPALDEAFDDAHWRVISGVIGAAHRRGMRVILDPHQYGRRHIDGENYIIGESEQVTAAHFAAFWGELARRCSSWPETIFGLQNEPHDQDRERLVQLNNTTIAAIRAAGARHLILVPGSSWSGAHSWVSSGNGRAMLAVTDPLNRMAFDVHQFLDQDSSGTNATCATNAGSRVERFTNWAREHRKRGFLGEIGAAANDACLTELEAALRHIAAHRDVWLGWAYWAGGPWWPDDYPLSVEPASRDSPQDRPQMAVLRRYFE